MPDMQETIVYRVVGVEKLRKIEEKAIFLGLFCSYMIYFPL